MSNESGFVGVWNECKILETGILVSHVVQVDLIFGVTVQVG